MNKSKKTEMARKEERQTEKIEAQKTTKISKALSFVLRHRPDSVGITLDEAGWTDVDLLCKAMDRPGRAITREVLEQVAADNDKQRFEFDSDKNRIRARQGHSVAVDLLYKSAKPPDVLYHGTARSSIGSILKTGLIKGNRHYVHMSINKGTMLAVATRHGTPVLLQIDAKSMHADKHQFFLTGNAVWLTDHVPPKYISVLE